MNPDEVAYLAHFGVKVIGAWAGVRRGDGARYPDHH